MYFLLSIISLVVVKSRSIAPAEQLKKFQGAMPINTESTNRGISTLICGKVRFISQFGDPGNSLKKII
jgi:hypothetical protein